MTVAARRPGTAAPSAEPHARRRPRRLPDGLWPYLFVGPGMAGILLFYIWPILQTFYFSFTKWGVFGDVSWTGVDNYAHLLADGDFFVSLLNTVVYSLIVCASIPVAVVLAALLDSRAHRIGALYRVLYFLPYIAMPVAISMIWRVIFNGDFGPITWLLNRVGVEGPHWLSTPGYAIVAISVVGFWSAIGFAMIVVGAGLRAVPAELREAAALDGAGPVRVFRSIIVPLLTPTIFFVTVITLIGSLQLFDLVFAMLGRSNPALPSSTSLVYYFYEEGFVRNDKGYAAAIAVAILVVIGVITLIQFRLQRRWVFYGD